MWTRQTNLYDITASTLWPRSALNFDFLHKLRNYAITYWTHFFPSISSDELWFQTYKISNLSAIYFSLTWIKQEEYLYLLYWFVDQYYFFKKLRSQHTKLLLFQSVAVLTSWNLLLNVIVYCRFITVLREQFSIKLFNRGYLCVLQSKIFSFVAIDK